MKDLAFIKYESYTLSQGNRLFQSRAEIDLYLYLSVIRDSALDMSFFAENPAVVKHAIYELKYPCENRVLDRKRSRVLNVLGKGLERNGNMDLALKAYSYSNLAPARERVIRILKRLGDHEGVIDVATRIVNSPHNELEKRYALKALGKKLLKRDIPVTEMTLDQSPLEGIEKHALHMLGQKNCIGWHLENQFSTGIFALAYWDWIYANVPGAFTNPFQSGPVDLFWPDFFDVRKAVYNDPLDSIIPIGHTLLKTYANKKGTANQLISWNKLTKEVLTQSVRCISENTLRDLVTIIRSDFNQFRTGFPDLVLFYQSGKYEFVEVKGPSDRVQPNQYLWMEIMLKKNIPVRILRFVHPE